MPIINSTNTDLLKEFYDKDIFQIPELRATTQDIRPLKIGIVNLMPNKKETEIHLMKVLSNTPLQIELDLIRTKSRKSKYTDMEYLTKNYKTLDEIKNNKYDGLIITGAPVEHLEFEEIDYWDELKELFEFARTHVYSSLFICWASQAALYYYYGVQKRNLGSKLSGVFEYELAEDSKLTRGLDDNFFYPQSRNTENEEAELRKVPDLKILARSDEAGVCISSSVDERFVFISGHGEYDTDTLYNEYIRDLSKGINPSIPRNYFKNDDPSNRILVRWKSSASLIFSNWINYFVYQQTPYQIEKIEQKVVAKFGGSSLSDSAQFAKTKDIILSDKNRTHIVVSAPGKRHDEDIKVTDLLESCYELKIKQLEIEKQRKKALGQVYERFKEISENLKLPSHVFSLISKTVEDIEDSIHRDFIISRGEYLNAQVLAAHLGYRFIDASELIFFDEAGLVDEAKTYLEIQKKLNKEEFVVIPGFYGKDFNGNIKTFERGGSDITGSIIARGMSADLYENWTDVDGVMTDDPRINENAVTISEMSYEQLLEMSRNGAKVYHPDAVNPVATASIPLRICNTNKPSNLGTLIQKTKNNK